MAGHDGPAPRTRHCTSTLYRLGPVDLGRERRAPPMAASPRSSSPTSSRPPRTYLSVDLLSSRKRRGYHLAVQQAHAGH